MKEESVLDHKGQPNDAQAAELMSYIANAITISASTTAALSYGWTKLWKPFGANLESFFFAIAFIAGFIGILFSIWSWVLTFKAIRGKSPNPRITFVLASALLTFWILAPIFLFITEINPQN